MDINYDELASHEFTVHAPSDGAPHTYRLRRMDANMQIALPRRMARAFEKANGRPAETDAEVQEWFGPWVEDTDEGQAFVLDVAFKPLDGLSPALSVLMSQGPLSGEDLAKIIFGQQAFFTSVTGSFSPQPGSAKPSASSRKTTRPGTMTVVRGSNPRATSRKRLK